MKKSILIAIIVIINLICIIMASFSIIKSINNQLSNEDTPNEIIQNEEIIKEEPKDEEKSNVIVVPIQ